MKFVLIDDSPEIANTISLILRIRWPDATLLHAVTGDAGIDLIETHRPHLAIIDINLPDKSGFEVLRQIRLFSDVPAVFLSVRSAEEDKVKGLLVAGADDYITKPFSALEFMARVQTVLRRCGMSSPNREEEPLLAADNLTINLSTGDVWVDGVLRHLTPTETKLLRHLVRNEGRVVTEEQLTKRQWGESAVESSSAIRVYIARLRDKMGDDAEAPRVMLTEHGVGDRFVRPK